MLPHTVSHVVGIADPITISPGFHSMLKNGSRKCNHRSSWIFQVQPEVIYWKKRPSANSAIIQQDVIPFRSPLLIPGVLVTDGWIQLWFRCKPIAIIKRCPWSILIHKAFEACPARFGKVQDESRTNPNLKIFPLPQFRGCISMNRKVGGGDWVMAGVGIPTTSSIFQLIITRWQLKTYFMARRQPARWKIYRSRLKYIGCPLRNEIGRVDSPTRITSTGPFLFDKFFEPFRICSFRKIFFMDLRSNRLTLIAALRMSDWSK